MASSSTTPSFINTLGTTTIPPSDYLSMMLSDSIVWLGYTLFILSTTAVGFRFYDRIEREVLRADDWCILVGVICYAACVGAATFASSMGIGYSDEELDWAHPLTGSRAVIIWGFIYTITTVPVKTSVCLALLRIRRELLYKVMTGFLIMLSMFAACLQIGFTLNACTPISYLWDQINQTGVCWPVSRTVSSIYAFGGINIFIDVAVALIPVHMLWKVQMAWSRKFISIAVIATSLLATIATAARMNWAFAYLDMGFWNPGFYYNLGVVVLLSELEIGLAILCACHTSAPRGFRRMINDVKIWQRAHGLLKIDSIDDHKSKARPVQTKAEFEPINFGPPPPPTGFAVEFDEYDNDVTEWKPKDRKTIPPRGFRRRNHECYGTTITIATNNPPIEWDQDNLALRHHWTYRWFVVWWEYFWAAPLKNIETWFYPSNPTPPLEYSETDWKWDQIRVREETIITWSDNSDGKFGWQEDWVRPKERPVRSHPHDINMPSNLNLRPRSDTDTTLSPYSAPPVRDEHFIDAGYTLWGPPEDPAALTYNIAAEPSFIPAYKDYFGPEYVAANPTAAENPFGDEYPVPSPRIQPRHYDFASSAGSAAGSAASASSTAASSAVEKQQRYGQSHGRMRGVSGTSIQPLLSEDSMVGGFASASASGLGSGSGSGSPGVITAPITRRRRARRGGKRGRRG